jgi:hypothetical protein
MRRQDCGSVTVLLAETVPAEPSAAAEFEVTCPRTALRTACRWPGCGHLTASEQASRHLLMAAKSACCRYPGRSAGSNATRPDSMLSAHLAASGNTRIRWISMRAWASSSQGSGILSIAHSSQ